MLITDYIYFQGIEERPKACVLRPTRIHHNRVELQDKDVENFLREVFSGVGLSVDGYRLSALQRRIPACLRFLKAPDLDAARLKFKRYPELMKEALSIVLLGVTEFNRDQPVFEHLRQVILPTLHFHKRRLRVWSAACSDGRELYSIAILMKELGLTNVEFLGTDCREEAIQTAMQGIYPPESLQKLGSNWREHFNNHGRHVQIQNDWKENLRWKQSDLFKGSETGPWDIVLWRNMAIYLKPEIVHDIWNSIIGELAPEGYIVCGKADHPPRHPEIHRVGPGIYQRK